MNSIHLHQNTAHGRKFMEQYMYYASCGLVTLIYSENIDMVLEGEHTDNPLRAEVLKLPVLPVLSVMGTLGPTLDVFCRSKCPGEP